VLDETQHSNGQLEWVAQSHYLHWGSKFTKNGGVRLLHGPKCLSQRLDFIVGFESDHRVL